MSDNIHQLVEFNRVLFKPLPNLLADSIRQAIHDGRLEGSKQLPSEPKLALQLGVSRATLRDAVRILVTEGALERRRGIGTFVSNNPLINLQGGLETLSSTTDIIRGQGYEPGTSDSRSETIPATERLAKLLDLAPGTPLLHLSRTRTANGIPVIQCEEYLAASLLGPQATEELIGEWSLYEVLRSSQSGVTSAVCRVVPVVADQTLAARLRIAPYHPLLLLCQTHYTTGHQPILYCENYHNCSIIEFHVIRRC